MSDRVATVLPASLYGVADTDSEPQEAEIIEIENDSPIYCDYCNPEFRKENLGRVEATYKLVSVTDEKIIGYCCEDCLEKSD